MLLECVYRNSVRLESVTEMPIVNNDDRAVMLLAWASSRKTGGHFFNSIAGGRQRLEATFRRPTCQAIVVKEVCRKLPGGPDAAGASSEIRSKFSDCDCQRPADSGTAQDRVRRHRPVFYRNRGRSTVGWCASGACRRIYSSSPNRNMLR